MNAIRESWEFRARAVDRLTAASNHTLSYYASNKDFKEARESN